MTNAKKEKGARPFESAPQTVTADSTRLQTLQDIAAEMRGNSAETQRERVMDALQALGTLSTVEARRHLDVMHPAQRVLELRSLGAEIETVWSVEPTECGRLHRMARYVLVPQQPGGFS